MTIPRHLDLDSVKVQAHDAFDRGALNEASLLFESLLLHRPDSISTHYMRGLVHKYLLDWPTSLHHNQRAIELNNEVDEAEHWNAAIAATALGQWDVARRLWTALGIGIDAGSGPIEDDFGVAVVRLNPWHAGETVWVRRIDPVRARVLNVPTPESGHRFGDIVLHDGASTGTRLNADGRDTPVFNELARMQQSEFQTFVVFVSCDEPADLRSLLDATLPGIGYAEDWTRSLVNYCLRCSYGVAHRHREPEKGAWQPDRNLGIAAQSRLSVETLLKNWSAAAPGRQWAGIETREVQAPELQEGGVWWREPEDDEST
ncbi:hypothetical protein [Pseudoxanthomonas indica]|uniref:Tetratricopeptide repeat-containing protein n=1 Tax=Pseudoxanthomonas indica TaxID=428993 RepID=A0A1T5LN38_9GAMM|nr:hypothetical protein [Pseudoxanthomonas indica]GGD37218.1 hypothetical protein GCM10007235_06680 [Pseudoxanthomonas indica]SKC77392.1 hypothetical protein SAMN06296058_2790 [Pseudoxanthomonas indica]